MPIFHYTVIDPLGQPQEGSIDAPTPDEAARILREERDCTVLKLEEQSATEPTIKPTGEPPAPSALPASKNTGDSTALASMVATLTSGQLPLEQGLRMLASEMQYHNPLLARRVSRHLTRLADLLDAGVPLDEAIRRAGGPADLIAIIRAGIAAGNPGKALSLYVANTRQRFALLLQLSLGIAYPLVLIGVGTCLLLGFLLWIVPTFKEILYGFDVELPAITILFINVSDILTSLLGFHFLELLILIILGSLLLACVPSVYARGWVVRIPVWGPIISAISMSRFTHTLGFLTENEVKMPTALRVAGESSRDAMIQSISQNWAECLESGQTLKQAAARIRGLPAEFLESLAWQQEPHFLAQALHGLGDMYEDRARTRTATLVALVEPTVIVFTSIVFLCGVFALLYPLTMLLNDLA